MVKYNFKNSLKLAKFDMKVCRNQIIGWSISLFAIMFLYMILFPSVEDMAQIKMDSMPKELLQFVGMSELSDMGDFVSYFGMIFKLMLIAISIFATTFAAGIIVKEEKTKTIEFLYSLEVSKTEIFVSKCLVATFGTIVLLVICFVSTIICGFINGGETFVLLHVLQIVKISGVTAFVFMGFGLFFAGVSAKIGAGAIGSMVVTFSYILGYLGVLLEDKASWLTYFSPFEILNYDKAVALDTDVLIWVGIYFSIALMFVIIGGIVYNNRDYSI